ncbi:hypothetical protein RFI_02143 [Reticulomyxa filosa]|uniref:RING-type E3 ubiquitin transferase n=1 Tax=Reticulomyxa filosa TaxID=46433 RepID=X6P9T3_RETFI|nr:hypothetical protein RFI_02143 [Reticulomyxa filosa]|eukprot:ETO34931.1 hypothetical protein RFI_02143 [Reticulomyxa filosa]
MFPMGNFPGLMFAGAFNENMDFETLMNLFPPAPRGAEQGDIEQLPVDTFRVGFFFLFFFEKKKKSCLSKPKEKNESDSKSNDQNNTESNDNKGSQEEEKKEGKKKDEFNQCCICLENFKDGDEIRRLPCLHIFHTSEIDEWLTRNHFFYSFVLLFCFFFCKYKKEFKKFRINLIEDFKNCSRLNCIQIFYCGCMTSRNFFCYFHINFTKLMCIIDFFYHNL